MRRLWPATVLAVCVVLLTPGAALAARPSAITHGLDFLHAKQRSAGGFSQSSANADPYATPWAILAIAAGSEAPVQWKSGGKSPIAFMQSLNLEAVALASQPFNPPAFYAKCILAYRAAGRLDLVYNAGTGHLDLVAKMNAYNGPLDGDGHYSPQTSGSRMLYSISTTGWAILALKAAGESGSAMGNAVDWLETKPYADGGFAPQPGLETADENTEDTALAVLALHAGAGSTAVINNALDYLTARQLANAGFQYTKGDSHAYAESTSWAIQAKMAADGDLAGWTKGSATPLTFLKSLQLKSGAFQHRKGVSSNALLTTAVSLIGYSQKFLPVYRVSDPFKPRWQPIFRSFAPASGAVFHTRSVTVTATYRDNEGGTGISVGAIGVTVDGKSKTGPAVIGSSKLTLKLTNLTSGQHTVTIKIADRAGNSKTSTHTFTVHVSTPGPLPTSPPPTSPPPTSPPPPTTPAASHTQPPTTLTPPATSTTYSPGPYPTDSASPWLSPSPSPSTSGSPVPGGTSGGGGWGPTLLGAALVALVPIGALASYAARRRLDGRLAGASRGKVLAGGGSALQRLRNRFGGGTTAAGG